MKRVFSTVFISSLASLAQLSSSQPPEQFLLQIMVQRASAFDAVWFGEAAGAVPAGEHSRTSAWEQAFLWQALLFVASNVPRCQVRGQRGQPPLYEVMRVQEILVARSPRYPAWKKKHTWAFLPVCASADSPEPVGIKVSYKSWSHVHGSQRDLSDLRDFRPHHQSTTSHLVVPLFSFSILHFFFCIFCTCSFGRLAIMFLELSLEPAEGYFQSVVTHFSASSPCLFSINDLTLILQ